ncbi:putative transcriptional regulatory protein [Colletotrichum fructicola]|nr:putative transcriptional regulatory protein [Colletotrichum fructicola]KAF4887394.1 putative transcriptional regulatory protein [Colletotrichum fructicola]KAF4931657.1 putative transcriptional regulatory protein [Colletotrichum fructicola]
MDADIPTLPAGTSDNSESGTLKRKRRPRHEFSCSYKDKPEEVKRMFDPTGRIQQRPQSQPIPAEQLHPSPVSLDEPLKVENPVTAANPHPPFMSEPPMERDRGSSVVSSEQEVDGLGQLNDHTEGAEFYGPTGTFYFLARLRSRANNSGTQKQPQQPGQPDTKTSPGGKTLNQTSVVNLLHSSDYSTSPDNRHGQTPGKGTPSASAATRRDSVQYGNGKMLTPADAVFATEVERECVRLYFQNLHNIHPILEQTAFVKRCDEEVWQRKAALEEPSQQRRGARFLSLFNSVIAIGAITAGETSLLMEDHTLQFLDRTELPGENETTYPPIRLARRYFERAKLYLEDICESSSLETAQTLFLMSVFCQNALKPHSCYMYSGMAIRTASAMGIPTNIRSETSQESLLWWSLYSHEIEMCFSAGRQSGLRGPSSYSIPFPRTAGFVSSSSCLINPMVDLAKILMWMTDNLSLHNSHTSLQRLSQTALNLDRELDDWKSGLPRELRFDTSSLEDSEFAMKQKTVLKLRFLNARILLHRQFLILKTPESDRKTLSRHVSSCVKAATETIRFMHTSYLHRPYFRTWWYNCMYLLDACMVLLHVLISNISSPFSNEEVIENLEMSIEIFKAMKMLAVARRCAEIVTELLHVAAAPKTAAAAGGSGGGNPPNQRQANEHVALQSDPATVAMKIQDETQQAMQQTTSPMFMTEGLDIHRGGDELGDNLIPGDFDANLVDPNVVWNFLNFEHWNAWSDAAFR